MIVTAQTQKQTQGGGLAKLLTLKIDRKEMLAVNMNIPGCLIKDLDGQVAYVEVTNGTKKKIKQKIREEIAAWKAMLIWF